MAPSTALRLIQILVIVSICSTGIATNSILEELGSLKVDDKAEAKDRCLEYEQQVRQGDHGSPLSQMSRADIYREIIASAPNELSLEERRIVADVQGCLADESIGEEPSSEATEGEPEKTLGARNKPNLIKLSLEARLALSKLRQEVKALPLEHRCQVMRHRLSEILAEPNSADIIQRAIDVLIHRWLPFGNEDPNLAALQECAEKDAEHQIPSSKGQVRSLSRKLSVGPTDQQASDLAPSQVDGPSDLSRDFEDLKRRFKEQSKALEAAERELDRLKGNQKQQEAAKETNDQVESQVKEELAKMKRELRACETSAANAVAVERSRFEQMKQLYEQVEAREARSRQRLNEAHKHIVKPEFDVRRFAAS